MNTVFVDLIQLTHEILIKHFRVVQFQKELYGKQISYSSQTKSFEIPIVSPDEKLYE